MTSIVSMLESLIDTYAGSAAESIKSTCFDMDSANKAIRSDLEKYIAPILHQCSRPEITLGERRLLEEFRFLERVVQCRIGALKQYLGETANALRETLQVDTSVRIPLDFLDGDSHCGARRPIFTDVGGTPIVIKSVDPRPYDMFWNVLSEIEGEMNIRLSYPKIMGLNRNTDWQILPFLKGDETASFGIAEDFSTRLGAVVAAAYVLSLSDLHLENIIVSHAVPVVIDAECILSNYFDPPLSEIERLIATGLVSDDAPELSGILGGGVELVEIEGHKTEGGDYRYLKPTNKSANRLKFPGGQLLDPLDHIETLKRSFCDTLHMLKKNSSRVRDIVYSNAYDSIRTRYICRPTAFYKCFLEMLFSPTKQSRAHAQQIIFRQLENSAVLTKQAGRDVVGKEISDLLDGDIPYFWLEGDAGRIQHRRGSSSAGHTTLTLESRRRQCIENLKHLNVTSLTARLGSILQGKNK